VESGILTGKATFEDYTDVSFAPNEATLEPYAWKGSTQ
jgi:hypothetical protein